MTTIVLEENDSAVLRYYPEKKILHLEYKKFMAGDTFRNILTKAAQAMKENGVSKWLSDDRLNPVLQKEDMQWAKEVFGRMALESGMKYSAIVQPASIIAKLDIIKASKEGGDAPVTQKLFKSPEEAMTWLESV